jgi:hypothetical protein
VRTLNRIVSLRDYEDFARSFAGIAKARAVLLRSAGRPLVHITVAGIDGADVPQDSDLYANLLAALRTLGDKEAAITIVSYARRLFTLRAQVAVDPRYLADVVLAEARAALLSAYSFSRRSFGQPVAAAEILEILYGIAGVRAATLVSLRAASDTGILPPLFPVTGSPPGAPPAVIPVDDIDDIGPQLRPLGLLLLHPAGVELEVMP